MPAKSTFKLLNRLVAATALTLVTPLLPAQPPGYYDTADTSSPEALRQSLHEIIDDHQRFPYTSGATDTWDVLEAADPNGVGELHRRPVLKRCRLSSRMSRKTGLWKWH